jgi:hypothetical protein
MDTSKRPDSLRQLRDPELVRARRNQDHGRSSHKRRTRSWTKVHPSLSDAVRSNFRYVNQDEGQSEIESLIEGITHVKRTGSLGGAAER